MRCSRAGAKLLKFARAAIFRPDTCDKFWHRAATRAWYARRGRAIICFLNTPGVVGFFYTIYVKTSSWADLRERVRVGHARNGCGLCFVDLKCALLCRTNTSLMSLLRSWEFKLPCIRFRSRYCTLLHFPHGTTSLRPVLRPDS